MYLLDFRTVVPHTEELVKLDLIEGHRIETGFYAGLMRSMHLRSPCRFLKISHLKSGTCQWIITKHFKPTRKHFQWARRRSYRILSPSSGWIMAGMTFGNREWDTLIKAYLTNQLEAGKISLIVMYSFYARRHCQPLLWANPLR